MGAAAFCAGSSGKEAILSQQTVQIEQLVDDQKIGRFNIKLLLWSWLAMFADGFDISALSFAVPELVRQWGVPGPAFKFAQAASNVGVLVGAPLLGYIGDKYGRRTAIVLGSVIFGVFTLSMTQATTIDQLTALRFLTGIGIGGLMPNTIALNAELAPRRWRALLVVLMFTGITLGSGTPGAVAGWLVPQFGWQILFVVGGVVPLAVAACLWFVLPESVKFLANRRGREAQLLKTARAMRPDLEIAPDAVFIATAPAAAYAGATSPSGAATRGSGFLGLGDIYRGSLRFITPLLWVCFATTLMANFFLNSWIPLILEGNGLTPKEAALASAGYHVGGTIGGLLVSLLLNRYGYSAIVALFVLAPIATFSMGLEDNSHAMITFLTCLTGFAVLGVQFGNNACAGLIYPTEARSNGVGWALGIGRLGAILGPVIGGMLLAQKMPLSELFAWASTPMAVGALAAAGVAALCYQRFRGLTLDEKAAEPEPASAASAVQPRPT
jgi:AAHS family 4-hydroxybenzoate transporter-like MFS transporter